MTRTKTTSLKKAIRADYVGTIHNRDDLRPMIGIICRPANVETKQVYRLTNIFTNGGRYDTYELENIKNGKRRLVKEIKRLKKSNPRPYTKEEVWRMIEAQDTEPAREFREWMISAENEPDNISAWAVLILATICDKHDDKMKYMLSISTSCKISCGDNAMRDNPEDICYHCFSDRQQDRQKNTRDKLIRNTYLYAFHDIPQEAFMYATRRAEIFRLESFGDLMNACQFENYLKLVRANPETTFTEWTKKPWIMNHVFKTENKPENLIIILSSPRLNEPITIEQARADWWFVDKTFTVYDSDYITENEIEINCGARECFTCRTCYEHNETSELRERKK